MSSTPRRRFSFNSKYRPFHRSISSRLRLSHISHSSLFDCDSLASSSARVASSSAALDFTLSIWSCRRSADVSEADLSFSDSHRERKAVRSRSRWSLRARRASPREAASSSCRSAVASCDRERSNSRLSVSTSSTWEASMAVRDRDGALIFVGMLDCGIGRAAGGGAEVDAVASTVRELGCGC